MASVMRDACGREQSLAVHAPSNLSDWAWITKISFPVFLTICTIGNILGLLLLRKDTRGTKRTFLLCLFSVNVCFMWTRLFLYLGIGVWFPPNPESLYGRFFTATAGYWFYMDVFLYLIAQWVVLAFTAERYIAISYPIYHRARPQKVTAIGAVVAITLLAAVSSLYTPIGYYWLRANPGPTNSTSLHQMSETLMEWRRVDMWIEAIVRVLVYLAIIGLDIAILRTLNQRKYSISTRSKVRSTSTSPTNVSVDSTTESRDRTKGLAKLRTHRNATTVLLCGSLFFLVTQCLEVVMSILVVLNNPPVCVFQITVKFLLIYGPIQVFFVSSYFSLNFLLYISPFLYLRTTRCGSLGLESSSASSSSAQSVCTTRTISTHYASSQSVNK